MAGLLMLRLTAEGYFVRSGFAKGSVALTEFPWFR